MVLFCSLFINPPQQYLFTHLKISIISPSLPIKMYYTHHLWDATAGSLDWIEKLIYGIFLNALI